MSFAHRLKLIGVLVLLMLAEVTVLALVAGALGVALGWLVAAALLPDVAATLRGLYGAQVSGELGLSPWWWLGGLGVALARDKSLVEAAIWGSVAASFAIEQVGMPRRTVGQDGKERWNGERVAERLDVYLQRL